MNERERQVRDEAYRIWEEKGRPHGDDRSHWHEAEKRVSVAEEGGKAGKASPKAPRAAPLKGAAVEVASKSPARAKKSAKATEPSKPAVVKGEGNAAVKTSSKVVRLASGKASKKG